MSDYWCGDKKPHEAHIHKHYDCPDGKIIYLGARHCIGVSEKVSRIYEEDMYADGSDEICSDIHFNVDCADVITKMQILKLLTNSGLKFNYSSYPPGYFDEDKEEIER